MTDQAGAQTADDTKTAEAKAAEAKAAEAAAADDEQARLKKQREREAAELRDQIRKDREKSGLYDSKFAATAAAQYMRAVIENVDPNTVDFITGMAGIKGIEQDKKKPGVATITANDGSIFLHKVDQEGKHSFGVTQQQLAGKPLDSNTAAHMADMCAAAGFTHVSLTGSVADKETMWLEASKRGLIVDNFVPRQEIQEQLKKHIEEQRNAMMQGVAPAQDATMGGAAPAAAQPEQAAQEQAAEASAPAQAKAKATVKSKIAGGAVDGSTAKAEKQPVKSKIAGGTVDGAKKGGFEGGEVPEFLKQSVAAKASPRTPGGK